MLKDHWLDNETFGFDMSERGAKKNCNHFKSCTQINIQQLLQTTFLFSSCVNDGQHLKHETLLNGIDELTHSSVRHENSWDAKYGRMIALISAEKISGLGWS